MFNFYLITFYLKYFPGNIFTNSLSFAASDLLSYIFSGLVLKKATTTQTLVLSYLISCIGGVLYICFHNFTSLIPLFIVLSRMGNSMSFNTVYVTNNRLFPTEFLASTYGIANLISHLLTIGAPLVAEIPDPFPFLVFVANTIIAIVAALFLREHSQKKDETLINKH